MSLFEETVTTAPKLDDLVGEGKKYKDADAIAKAVIEKDNFIERLKSEQEVLRQELAARPAVDRSQEILDRLEALNKKEPVTERIVPTITERTEVKGVTPDEIERILNEREQKKLAEANIQKVKATLQEKYGDRWAAELKTTAEKLGVTPAYLERTAAESPNAFFRLMGESTTRETLFTPPASSVQFAPSAGTSRNEKYYNQLKAADPKKYFSPEIRNQQYKDMMELKESYYA